MIVETLTKSLKKKFEEDDRKGIHVSDLTLCPRKSIFDRLEDKPLSMRDLNFFTSGRAIHDSIQILAKENGDYEIEKEVEKDGIIGHIDLFDKKNNIPIECKSMRVKEAKEAKSHHIDQLESYMAMTNSKQGILLYQLLLHYDDKPFVEFEHKVTDEQLEKRRQWLINRAKKYTEIIEKQLSPMEMVGVFNDPKLNWLCRSCSHRAQCEMVESEVNELSEK